MRAVVTVLRAPVGAGARAAAASVDYVMGSRQATIPTAHESASSELGGYFLDRTPEGPGRWVGRGTVGFGLRGAVAREDLEALLRGEDPRTSSPLTRPSLPHPHASHATAGSAGGAGWEQATFTFQEAAALVGVSDRYLRKLAGKTRGLLVRTGGDAETLDAVLGSRSFLVAHQGEDGRWRVTRDELLRFAASRRQASVVIGYDVTFSAPKSVSLLWARADVATRTVIMDAFANATEAGLRYLEQHATFTGRGPRRVRGDGLTGAAFTHLTSRAADPQLHRHVVLANTTRRPDGSTRALSGRELLAHAKTAGYLATAQLQADLRARLGVRWKVVRSGIAEIDGVPRPAIEAMSTRRAEIDATADDLGVASAKGRRAIARATRAAKEYESLDVLEREWVTRLDAAGFGPQDHARCLNHGRAVHPMPEQIAEVFDRLLRHDGLTANRSTFAREDAIQALVDWSVDRLPAIEIGRLADRLLTDPRVLEVTSSHTDQRPEKRYTTRAMVRAESRVLEAFRRGVRALTPGVDPALLTTLADASGLDAEQRDALERLVRSPHRVQCLIGPAGSGKTTLVRAAAAAWSAAGLDVAGVAVQGTAAENLERRTGITSETMAGHLMRAEHEPPSPARRGRVLVVDEASAVCTIDLARLVDSLDAATRVVLVGDPAQHSSVAAGGAFAALARRWGHLTIHLTGSHRQAAERMTQVSAATDELRRRDTDAGLHRLLVDHRVTQAATRADAYDQIVRDWAHDRAGQSNTATEPVCMITDDHRTRRALNQRAREHLQSIGVLHGPQLRAGGQEFQAGDEVIARAPARNLHPPGEPARHVRNGTRGRVTAITERQTGMWVDFEDRGLIFVPHAALEHEHQSGARGIVTHSYALTSHAAQGATFATARLLVGSSTSPAGLYVGVSRGRDDVGIYTATDTTPDPEDAAHAPVVRDSESGLQVLAREARNRSDETLAIEQDPTLLTRFTDDRTVVAAVPEAALVPEPRVVAHDLAR